VLIVAIWCGIHLAVFSALTLLYRKVTGAEPSEVLFESPHRLLVPSFGHVLIAVGSVLLLTMVPGVGRTPRSVWFASGDRASVLVCAVLGLVPTLVNVLAVTALHRSGAPRRRRAQRYPVGRLMGFTIALSAHAFVEELLFRNVPLALMGTEHLAAAYAIPVLAFIAVHFLGPRRPRSPARVVHLAAGALFFFVVACRFGLFHATVAHVMANLSVGLTEGYWEIGALAEFSPGNTDARFRRNAIGYLLSVVILLIVYGC